MSKVTFDISMSLDGYITAAGQTSEEPLGDGGERLHEWAFGQDAQNREILESAIAGCRPLSAAPARPARPQ